MRLLWLLFILLAVYSRCTCPVNETLRYIELNRSLDYDFEAYIDLPFSVPDTPQHRPALTQLNSSLFIHIKNQLNGSFYIHEMTGYGPELFRDNWSTLLTERLMLRIISMFPSTVYSNVSTLYSYCFPEELPSLGPKDVKMDPHSVPWTRKDHIWLLGMVVAGVFLMFIWPSPTVPPAKPSK
jgi:hypothetical protein